MAVWHPTIDAYEVHGTRRESWDSSNPQVVVTLEVAHDKVGDFINYIVKNKPAMPSIDHAQPWQLYALRAEVQPTLSCYDGIGTGDEVIDALSPVRIIVTYGSSTHVWNTISADIDGTGSGTATRSQTVPEYDQVQAGTEFLTLDYNDYCWNDTNKTPLSSADLAPGKPFKYIKWIATYEMFEIDDLFGPLLIESNSTVNVNTLSYPSWGLSFAPEQVLFTVEDIAKTVYGTSYFSAALVQFYTVRVSFNCRIGESTWNKLWRTKTSAGVDDSGWFEIIHKKTDTSSDTPVAKLHEASANWQTFWNS